jgi:hypothetical protein
MSNKGLGTRNYGLATTDLALGTNYQGLETSHLASNYTIKASGQSSKLTKCYSSKTFKIFF